MRAPEPARKDGPRINEEIRVREVHLIDRDGTKKAAEARKKQKVVEVKELKYRPMIDDHDYEVKLRAMQRFFEEGDKVKVTLRFRGREMAHQELGTQLLNRVKEDV